MKKLLLFASLIFFSCSEEKIKPTIDPSAEGRKIPLQESWKSSVQFSEEGNIKAVLYSDHLMVFDEPKETLLENIKIDFYDRNSAKTTTLTAKRGKVDDITKNMFAIDSVVAVNDSGVTLSTNELMWRNKDRKIVTDKFVSIVSSKEKIEGYGFESDQSLKNYVIYQITYSAAMVKLKEDSK